MIRLNDDTLASIDTSSLPIVSLADRFVRFGQRIAQAFQACRSLLLALAMFAILLKSLPMLLAICGYTMMQLCYGKCSYPLRTEKQASSTDILIVSIGLLSLCAYLLLMVNYLRSLWPII